MNNKPKIDLHSEVFIEPAGNGYFIIVKDDFTENRLAVSLEELGMLYGKLIELMEPEDEPERKRFSPDG